MSGSTDRAPHLTPTERADVGKAARERVPRKRQGTFEPSPDRPDPVSLLEEQERTRVPELLPLHHERMGASAFAFYRGTAIVMATDLGSQPDSGLIVQLCGDAHLSNFGLYASPDRVPVFDVNDFDETNPGPFEWDVKRLACSFTLAARDNGFPASVATEAATAAARQYRQSMADYAMKGALEVWYDRVDARYFEDLIKSGGSEFSARKVRDTLDLAQQRTTWTAVRKLTAVVDGRRQFLDEPPILVRVPEDAMARVQMPTALQGYLGTLLPDRRALLERYEVIDMGHKVVGVGSVGLTAWVLLMQGRDADDLLVLQVKQAQQSVLEPHTAPSAYANSGERVVEGQRLMQAASDSFLGWLTGSLGREYYVRQLRDMKWGPDPAGFSPKRLVAYAQLCGHVLARGHARSGDPIAIAAYLGTSDTFDTAMAAFSRSYAEIVAADFARFQEALTSGRLAGGRTSEDVEDYRRVLRDPSRIPVR